MPDLANPNLWIGLLTLTVLEIVLSVDNVVFISILTGKLPEAERKRAWNAGIMLALVTRVVMLLGLSLLLILERPLFNAMGRDISGRDIVLVVGGLFLIWKAVKEIHGKLEGDEHGIAAKAATFGAVVAQLALLNVVFSIDSVLTAIGMTKVVAVMVAAVVLSTVAMLVFADEVGAFVEKHPTVKMLGLAFLILIGFNLVAEGTHVHIPKGYTYFAMAFAMGVEFLNLRLRSKGAPVRLHEPRHSG
ncbi:MAG: TerC family protein [Fimbriimonadaceae bacterium]|nr:TerC family protein [Fimbriimonadaceae bacterium]QYK59102.1 MAG: TerC family protein [Fimbriimonadaceae bacterium]